MSSIHHIPKVVRFTFLVVLFNVAMFTLLRLSFYWWFTDPGDPLGSRELGEALFIGFKFDVRLALLMVLPILMVAWLRWLNPFARLGENGTWLRHLWSGYLIAALAFVILIYITHFGYYAYLSVPLDATILRFFANPEESALMVWQSYPVVWIVAGWALVLSVYALSVYRMLAVVDGQPLKPVRRRYMVAMITAVALLVLFGIYGKVSWYPLRWSDAFFSTHPFANVVAVNPVLHSYETLKNKDVQFDLDATSERYDQIAAYLGVDEPDRNSLNFSRMGHASALNVGRHNVVLVLLESFASYKTSLSANPLDPTPFFASLARDGVYFNNFFVPHTGTARSVFTTVTGLPDVETHKTSTRNPLIVNQHTIINAFEGYEKLYFIGGSASWGNIRGLLQANIPGLKLYEEGSYTSPRIDVWGISDLHLFAEANQVLREQKEPFFAVIQTSGNHRPYTIPDDRRGFEIKDVNSDDVFRYGFHSPEEYNSFRFMDHCVRVFMETVRKEPYFDNTIFVFYGDHGIHANAGQHTPKFEEQLNIHGLRVPFVLYAPKVLPHGIVLDKVASEVDVLPTLAGLTVGDYLNTTLGRDLFDERFDAARYAFTVTHGQGLRVGLLDHDFYFLMNDDGSNKVLHKLHSETPRADVSNEYPDEASTFEGLTRAIFEATRYMRYHNARPES